MRNGLSVESRGDLIIVTQSGTEFSATDGKGNVHSGILLLAATTDPQSERALVYQFRADASEAAVRKARELEWIV